MISFFLDEVFRVADLELDSPAVSDYVTEQYASNLAVFDYMTKRTMLPWSFK